MPISSLTHGAADAFRNIGDFAVGPGRADHQARRDRARALGQDRVHHRARAQSHGRRPPAVLRRPWRMAAFAASISSRSLTTGAALRLRAAHGGPHREPAALAGEHAPHQPAPRRDRIRAATASGSGSSARAGSISTSSTIPANGCSTCRCSELDYAEWSSDALEQSRRRSRQAPAAGLARGPRRRSIRRRRPTRCWRERLADLFKAYLRDTRADAHALSTLPPGRFLMPGDLEGSPALTFAPLDAPGAESFPRGSLFAMMERRYEAYKTPRGAAVLPRSFRAARPADRADRRARGAERRQAGGRRPRARHDRDPRLFQDRLQQLWSSLFAPRIDRIAVRRDQGRPSPSHEP